MEDNWNNFWGLSWTIILLGMFLIGEIIEMIYDGIKYFSKFENILEILLLIFSCGFIITSMLNYFDYSFQFAAWMLFFTWIDFAHYLGKFSLGEYIYMIRDVANNLSHCMLPFTCFILAFTFGFHALLYNDPNFRDILRFHHHKFQQKLSLLSTNI